MADENNKKYNYNPEQYNMLKRCSDKKNMSEWNEWRKNNKEVDILLEGACFVDFWLKGVDLKKNNLKDNITQQIILKNAKFQNADLEEAKFQGAWLQEANFKDATLWRAKFQKAHLHNANLQNAKLDNARLQGAILCEAMLQGAKLNEGNLQKAIFQGANLQKAELKKANLKGAKFKVGGLGGCKLNSTIFTLAHVDGMTIIELCEFDKETDFTGVGLDAATIDPGLKAAFKNNIRRIHWQDWIKKKRSKGKRIVPWLVKYFWWVSDYGSSTTKIFKTFFELAFVFCLIYWLLALIPGWDGIIKDLWQGNCWVGGLQTLIRALYFSVVTMTTLGFGDMHAASNGFLASVLGNIFLSFQVMIGYILLGALVTRLGILFTSEAPAVKPTPMKKTKNKD